ncbi:hypothetical protein BGZ65_012912 [Modicella reniformis]|uniref:Uncharacterized protein n=1 Tax=Modicella reniformis TaxID=1440133 RepID=A0A9P6LT93_9FUNG|nr:hypothetical protein BGZ65_012912 [Modicella reniformis]
MHSSAVIQTPPKERQTVIDKFFIPIPDNSTHQQPHMESSLKSQYFPGDSLCSIDDPTALPHDGHDVMMDFHCDLPPQAVPTFPVSSSGPNFSSTEPNRQQHGYPFAPRNDHAVYNVVPQESPTILTIRSTRAQPKSRSIKGRTKKTKVSTPNDPAEIHGGGTRLRSIQFVKSIQDILDGSVLNMNLNSESERSTVALVEVVGVLVSRMSYHNACWEFTIRDPTVHDMTQRHQMTPIPNLGPIDQLTSSLSTLDCQMYDAINIVDQETLERDEVLRIVGIVSQSKEPCSDQELRCYQLQSVAIRSASMDELRMTVQSVHRGLDKRQG